MSSNLAESNNPYRSYDHKFLKFKEDWKNFISPGAESKILEFKNLFRHSVHLCGRREH